MASKGLNIMNGSSSPQPLPSTVEPLNNGHVRLRLGIAALIGRLSSLCIHV